MHYQLYVRHIETGEETDLPNCVIHGIEVVEPATGVEHYFCRDSHEIVVSPLPPAGPTYRQLVEENRKLKQELSTRAYGPAMPPIPSPLPSAERTQAPKIEEQPDPILGPFDANTATVDEWLARAELKLRAVVALIDAPVRAYDAEQCLRAAVETHTFFEVLRQTFPDLKPDHERWFLEMLKTLLVKGFDVPESKLAELADISTEEEGT